MKVYAVWSGVIPYCTSIHQRAWMADWVAWQVAKTEVAQSVWEASPTYGYPGWRSAEDPADTEAEVWVQTIGVSVP